MLILLTRIKVSKQLRHQGDRH